MASTLRIETRTGTVQGTTDGSVRRFYGIPYAKSPVGDLRFRHAEPVERWDGVRNATSFGPPSPQRGGGSEEDCLTLNIWAPHNGQMHPVLFFIHGGSFMYGSGSFDLYNGDNLCAAGEVVLVTFNYRLGPLGFMSFDDPRFEDNCGFTDMMEALRWVHANIERFGGDPDNITVAGQSAGAICASAFPVHPEMRQLMSKVMMMSGSPTLIRPFEEHAGICRDFARRYVDGDPFRLLDAPASQIMRWARDFQTASGLGEGTFSVTLDGSVIQESPIAAAARGAAEGIPIFLGTVREEMACAASPLFSKGMDLGTMVQDNEEMEGPEMMRRLNSAYDESYGKRAQSLYLSDRSFRMGALWYGQVYSEHAPCWMYRFDYASRVCRMLGLRAMHSTDLPLFFANPDRTRFRLLYTLDMVKKGYLKVMRQINRDMFDFMRCGDLPWEQFSEERPMGRIYDENVDHAPVVAEKVRKLFAKTKFHDLVFEDVGGC